MATYIDAYYGALKLRTTMQANTHITVICTASPSNYTQANSTYNMGKWASKSFPGSDLPATEYSNAPGAGNNTLICTWYYPNRTEHSGWWCPATSNNSVLSFAILRPDNTTMPYKFKVPNTTTDTSTPIQVNPRLTFTFRNKSTT